MILNGLNVLYIGRPFCQAQSQKSFPPFLVLVRRCSPALGLAVTHRRQRRRLLRHHPSGFTGSVTLLEADLLAFEKQTPHLGQKVGTLTYTHNRGMVSANRSIRDNADLFSLN